MRTVAEIIESLKQFPPDAKCGAVDPKGNFVPVFISITEEAEKKVPANAVIIWGYGC